MGKNSLSLTLIMVLVLSLGAMAFAAPSFDNVGYEVKVTSPYAEFEDDEVFYFEVDVNADQGLQNYYVQTKNFEVRSTTRYRIELQMFQYGGPGGIQVDWNAPRYGTIIDLFDAAVQGWPVSGFGWKNVDNFQTRVDYNTLNGKTNASVHTLGLKLVLVEDSGVRRVLELPSGSYRGILRLVVTENL